MHGALCILVNENDNKISSFNTLGKHLWKLQVFLFKYESIEKWWKCFVTESHKAELGWNILVFETNITIYETYVNFSYIYSQIFQTYIISI